MTVSRSEIKNKIDLRLIKQKTVKLLDESLGYILMGGGFLIPVATLGLVRLLKLPIVYCDVTAIIGAGLVLSGGIVNFGKPKK